MVNKQDSYWTECMLAKLKKEIMIPEEGVTVHLLDFFMKTRADELKNNVLIFT